MSQAQIMTGGLAVPAPTRVATDQATIFGDGSIENPLTGGGVGGVVIHDGTLTGSGTSLDPLGVDAAGLDGEIAVAVDNATITGNGTTGSPLHTIGGTTTVDTDGTLTGNGSSGQPLGVDAAALAGDIAVAVDGTTIAGNGTTGSPLHAIGGGTAVATDATLTGNGTTGNPLHVVSSSATPGSFKADFTGIGGPIPGKAVTLTASAPVAPAVASVIPYQPGSSSIVGVISAINGDGTVQVQSLGLVTLSEAQWSAARGGGSGGLAAGESFYAVAAGLLDDVAPTGLGSFVNQVGVALSSTIMAVSCPSVPLGPQAASALVKSNAYVTSEGFTGGVGHSGTGRYQLTLETGALPADDNCIVTVTLATNFSVAVSVAAAVVAGVVDVFISTEPGGAGIDGDFQVTVIDNS